jgi:hypothetical protein
MIQPRVAPAALRELTADGIIHASTVQGRRARSSPMQSKARIALLVAVAALVAACATSTGGGAA